MAVDYTWVWCAQFGEAPDYWLSSPGTFEQYGSESFSCSRQWTVIKTSEFDALRLAASAGTPSTTAPVYALSVADGTELAWLIGGAWVLAYAARLVIAPIKSALFSPGDDS